MGAADPLAEANGNDYILSMLFNHCRPIHGTDL